MSNEEKKAEMSKKLSAALNPVKIENPANIDPVTRQEVTKRNLTELKVEIKFHLGQMAGHAVEIGNLLIEAKEQVEHGEWYNWLEENFNLSPSSASRFMKCAERFSNRATLHDLNYSQMIQLLALPAGKEENFIADKAAEGNPVEDMTVKKLRAEVAEYKKQLEEKNSEVKDLSAEKTELERKNSILKKNCDGLKQANNDRDDAINELTIEKNSLQEQLKNQKPIEKIVIPDDYDDLKKEVAEKEIEVAKLKKQLQDTETTIEVNQSEELERAQQELLELQGKFSEAVKRAEIFQKIDMVCLLWKDIFQSQIGGIIFGEYEKLRADRYNEFIGSMTSFLKINGIM